MLQLLKRIMKKLEAITYFQEFVENNYTQQSPLHS